MDDRDHPRGEEEEGHGGQDLDGGPPERHGGDGEGDEERGHAVSSPARGGLPSALEQVGFCHHWTFIWIRVPVLGTVDGPTSAVLFVYAVR
jgi:hypothetical protein